MADQTLALIREKEGFASKGKWDNNAYRNGYGSDTMTAADGTVTKVTKGAFTTKADAERDLLRRVPEFQRDGIIAYVGQAAWDAMSPAAKASVTSLAYNYGSLNGLPSLIKAIKSGDNNAIGNAIADRAVDNVGQNSARRKDEAALVLGHPPVPGEIGGAASDAINSAFPSTLDQSLMSYATGGMGSNQDQVSRMYAGIYPPSPPDAGNVQLPMPRPNASSATQPQSLPGMFGRGQPSPGAIDQLAGIVGQSQTPHIGDTDPQAAARRPPMDWAAFKPGMSAGGMGSLVGQPQSLPGMFGRGLPTIPQNTPIAAPLRTPSNGMTQDQASQLYAGIYPPQSPSGLQTRSVTTVPIDPHTGNPVAPVAAPFVSEDHPTSNAVPRPAYNPGVPDWMVRRQASMAAGSPQTNVKNFTDPLSSIGQAPSWASLQAFNPQSALPAIPPKATVPGAAYAATPNLGGGANDVGSGASWGDVQSFNAPADKTTYYPKGQNYGYNTSSGNYEVKSPGQAYSYGSLPANKQFPFPSIPAYNPNTFGAADLVKVPSSVSVPQYITINKQVQVPSNLPIATGDGVHWDAALGNYVLNAAPAAPKMQTITKQVRVLNPAYKAPVAAKPPVIARPDPYAGMSPAAKYAAQNANAKSSAIANSSNPSSNSARATLASSWGFE